MIGEANFMQDKVYFGYDVNLNQLITGTRDKVKGYIDFPYTFVGPNCLETLMEDVLKRKKAKNTGIYAEINTTKERPVKKECRILNQLEKQHVILSLSINN